MASFWKVEGLVLADKLADYSSLSLMAIFLTDDDQWGLSYTIAATIVNVFEGLVDMMPFVMQFIADAFLSNYSMVLYSSLAYALGLGLMAISACSKGILQKIFFFIALCILVVGKSSNQLTSFDELVQEDDRPSTKFQKFLRMVALIAVSSIGIFVISFIESWAITFEIAAATMFVATVLFWCGSPRQYQVDQAERGSPLTTTSRVYVAAFLRRSSQRNEVPDGGTTGLRCLDEATISLENEQAQNNRWRQHCQASEVKQTKRATYAIPLCMTFFVTGVISSIGDSYFFQQAETMNRNVGHYEAPLEIMRLFYFIGKGLSRQLYSNAKKHFFRGRSRKAGCVGIAVSMILAMACCLLAARMENQRLFVVKRDGLQNSAEKVPMTIFWLVPQFTLLGGLDKISEKSIEYFFTNDNVCTSSDRFMRHFASGIFGFGKIGGVLSVYIVGKISASAKNSSGWFQDSLNKSHLDYYYWVLAVLSILNLLAQLLLYYGTSLKSEVNRAQD